MRRAIGAGVIGLALAGALTAGAEKKDIFALVGARVLPVSGAPLEHGTLVLRDGVIEALGADLPLPPDARVIDAKGLTLTPGLIDAFGGVGLSAPRKASAAGRARREDDDEPARGLTPEALALAAIEPGDALKVRDQGITTVLAVAREGTLPGRSVLLNLAGDSAQQMVLRQPAALHLNMMPLRGRYPDSVMGVMALARQALLDARHYGEQWAAYERAPAGKRRPLWDARLEAWSDVREGRLPLVIHAPREGDLRRALALRDEFGVRVVAAGAQQAARVVGLLRDSRMPLLVSVDFDPPSVSPQFGPRDEDAERRDIAEARRNPAALHRAGLRFALVSGHGTDFLAGVRATIQHGLPRAAALRALTLDAAEALGLADRLGSLEPGKLANVVAWQGEPLTPGARPKLVFVDGALYEPTPERESARRATEAKLAPEADIPSDPTPERAAAAYPPEPAPADGVLALVGATLLTMGPAGTFANGTLVLEHGRIAAVGTDVPVPSGARVLDLRGRFVMPGIIDAHSHTAIEGGVNECTDAVTAEVRVADVIDARDPNLYRQLAGGVTTIHALHGSCNAIGGQSAVLKLRWGRTPEQLLFEGAPRSIKFALGENPKRANERGRAGRRYPGTRMGIEALLRDEFAEAREYAREWAAYEAQRAQTAAGDAHPVTPRRDLRLEALRDVLEGKLWVHAHCYRADEMLMLMRLADEFGFELRTLQHVLEGYKVAGEIARHGVGASTFIDWWGFKQEAFDATPFNPAVMARHGVLVSLNSDSAELARRLYWDAAKAVHYGGVSEDDALRMITLNPARQLGIDARVGSLEPGKDADLAVFSTHPLAPEARVELTLVDGVVYFDRARDLAARPPAAAATGGPPREHARGSRPGTVRAERAPASDARKTPPAPAAPHAAPTGESVALTGGRIVTVSGATLERGTLVMAGGRIAAIGADLLPPPGARVIDVSGRTVYPGLIDALTTVGLVEINSVPGSVDTTEVDDFNPEVQAWLAINPHSELIPVARAGGITTVLTAPQGRLISGRSALMRLAGDTPDAMLIKTPSALHMVYPDGRRRADGARPAEEPEMRGFEAREKERREQQAEDLRRLADRLAEARAYAAARQAAGEGRLSPPPPDVELEALAPAALGELPVVMRADAEDEIRGAVSFARQHGLRLIVAGGLDAWRCAELLREHDVPVLLNVERLPRREQDAYDAPYANAAALQRAGVRFAIVSDDAHNSRNLPYEAAMARAFGLSEMDAWRAITLAPAEIFGVATELGSLEPGKRADVIVADGDIMDARRRVLQVFVGGVEQPLETRHTRLDRAFRERRPAAPETAGSSQKAGIVP